MTDDAANEIRVTTTSKRDPEVNDLLTRQLRLVVESERVLAALEGHTQLLRAVITEMRNNLAYDVTAEHGGSGGEERSGADVDGRQQPS